MASLARIINVQVSLFTVAVKVASFDGLMVLDFHSAFPERVRSYEDMEGVAADFDPTDASYLALGQALAQSPQISKVYSGRRANNPVKKVELTPVAEANRRYKVWVNGVAATFDSTTAVAADIVDGLETAINALSAGLTVVNGTTKLTITSTVATKWFSVDVDNVNLIVAQQTHTDAGGSAGIEADLNAIKAENDDWYAFTPTTAGLQESKLALAWGQTNHKLCFIGTQDGDSLLAVGSDSGPSVAKDNMTVARDYGIVCFHSKQREFVAAAWLGATLTSSPGAITFMLKQLKGVSGDTLSSTQIDNLEAKNANYFTSFGGNNAITALGMCGSGQFIDVIRDSDWFTARLQTRFYAIMINNPKITFTDKGIKMLANAMRAQVKEAQVAGFLNDDPSTVSYTVPKVADISGNDKAARLLSGLGISAQLAGAIHKVSPLRVNIVA